MRALLARGHTAAGDFIANQQALTYMSIRRLIGDRVNEQRLFVLEPLLESDPIERTLVISPEIQSLLCGPWPSVRAGKRMMDLRADLESFVVGDQVSACLVPYKAEEALFGRLDKPADEVWDIRSRKPAPGIRLLGRFAEQDCFVALSCWPRSVQLDYLSRPPLGRRNSSEWAAGIKECKAEWRKLFFDYPAHTGTTINDYISVNVDLV
ncbi:MAG: hypothetical protein AB7I59_04100 [Geminicoccaceae bacterium]